MNSRIQELIKQCTDIVEIVNPDTNITHHREFFNKEKFAELIVRECASLAYDGPGGILDHFGLEEQFGVEE